MQSKYISNFLVESTTPPGTPPHAGSSTTAHISTHHKLGATDPSSSPSKRRYVADAQDVEIVKKIKQNEVELKDRTTVLRGIKPNVSPPLTTPC